MMIPRTPFLRLYETIGLEAWVKQQKLARLTGGGDWHLDRDRAELRIGELRSPVQFLGTESYLSETWQWANADVQAGLSPGSLADRERVRSALRGSVPGTVEPDRFAFGGNVGDPDATSLARVACGLAGASATYKCEHEDGAVYVLLHDERIDATPVLDVDALSAAFAVFQW